MCRTLTCTKSPSPRLFGAAATDARSIVAIRRRRLRAVTLISRGPISEYSRMGLTLQDIHDCRVGYRNPIVVGELPESIRRRLKLRIPTVHLSRESLAHINQKHPDITDLDLPHIPHVIECGTLMQERAKPNIILSHCKDEESHRHYVTVMKIVAGYELWLSSFYRVRDRQIEIFRKRHIILRRALNTN